MVAYVSTSTNVKLTTAGVVMAPNGLMGLYTLFGMIFLYAQKWRVNYMAKKFGFPSRV